MTGKTVEDHGEGRGEEREGEEKGRRLSEY